MVLGALGLSTLLAVIVLNQTLTLGSQSYTAGAWTPPWGIELLVDPLSALMLLLISAVSFIATFAAVPCVKRDLEDRQHIFFGHHQNPEGHRRQPEAPLSADGGMEDRLCAG